jgi:hypothetical protein
VTSRCGNTCASNFADCDGLESTGCEADVRTSLAHCGGCGRPCSPPGGVGACVAGTCTVARCVAGSGDCDGNPLNGCETDVTSTITDCGACGNPCSQTNTVSSCIAGACRITQCTGSFDNCDGNAANGCETNIGTSNTHCGLCGSVCPAGTTCVVGRCTPTAPFAGYAVTTPPPGVAWIDACAAPGRVTALGAVDDEYFDGFLPFPVTFWGGRNQNYLLDSNGVVGFGRLYYNLNTIPGTGPLRSWGLPETRLAPAAYLFGVDLFTGPTGICVATVGAAPNRTWVAQYLSAQLYVSYSRGTPSAFTFELLAYESNANLDVLYNAPFTVPSGFTPPISLASPDPVVVGLQDYRSITPARVVNYTGPITSATRVRFAPL